MLYVDCELGDTDHAVATDYCMGHCQCTKMMLLVKGIIIVAPVSVKILPQFSLTWLHVSTACTVGLYCTALALL